MKQTIQVYRHHETVKDSTGRKIPSPTGVALRYIDGIKGRRVNPDSDFQIYHSSSPNTQIEATAYSLGARAEVSGHHEYLDKFPVPEEIRRMREELGDSEACHVRFGRYDPPPDSRESSEVEEYYMCLASSGESLAGLILDFTVQTMITNGDEHRTIVFFGHEPTLSVSLLEIAKKYPGYEQGNIADAFPEIAGTNEFFLPYGGGYNVEVRESGIATLVTAAGERELEIRK